MYLRRVGALTKNVVALALLSGSALTLSAGPASAQTGGSISGNVTAATGGAPLSGICVGVEQVGGIPGGLVATNAKGHYSVSGLPSASYVVNFNPDGQCTGGVVRNYVSQCYNDQQGCGADTYVSVTAGAKTKGIDAALETGGIITGTVRSPQDRPLSGICVFAGDTSDTYFGGITTTRADGHYSIYQLPTGKFSVRFSGSNGPGSGCSGGENQNYAQQWYADKSTAPSANPVPVTAGATTPSINAVLQRGAKIVGTISASGGGPLSGICVEVSGSELAQATSGSNGRYSIIGLTTGTYSVSFNGCGQEQNYVLFTAEVSLTAGESTRDNVSLLPGGTITGTVTAADGGKSLDRMCVLVFENGGNGQGNGFTSSSGEYLIDQLPAGNYTVLFRNCQDNGNYAEQWYNGQPTYTTAEPVAVSAGGTTTSIDAALDPGGVISGTVTAAVDSAPISGLCVDAQEIGGAGYGGEGVSASDGTYSVENLPTGSYAVDFGDCGDPGGYTQQWYNDESIQSNADPVSVTEGATTGSLDASMQS